MLRARAYTAYTARRGIGLVAVPVLRAGFRASGPNALEYVGVLAVEIFVVQGNGGPKVLVNEIAPRVHNSGHWTLDGASISQFEQHIRAIAG